MNSTAIYLWAEAQTCKVRIRELITSAVMRQYFLFTSAQCMTFSQIQLDDHMLSDSQYIE
jgi:hypothetical protein